MTLCCGLAERGARGEVEGIRIDHLAAFYDFGYIDDLRRLIRIDNLVTRSVNERVGALIEIAHPDFRDELRSEGQRLYTAS